MRGSSRTPRALRLPTEPLRAKLCQLCTGWGPSAKLYQPSGQQQPVPRETGLGVLYQVLPQPNRVRGGLSGVQIQPGHAPVPGERVTSGFGGILRGDNPTSILRDPENCGRYYNCSDPSTVQGLNKPYLRECTYPKLFASPTVHDGRLRQAEEDPHVSMRVRRKSVFCNKLWALWK